MTVDVLDYMGQHNGGIIVLLSLGFQEEYYEATFYYKEALVVLTVEDKLQKKIGCEIEDWSGYEKLMYDIITKVVPFEEMIGRIDEFKPESWDLYLDTGTQSS